MDVLWPELGMRAQANNLRYALHTARRVLEPEAKSSSSSRYLPLSEEVLALCPQGPVWVDVEAFEEAARRAFRSREPSAYRTALDLYAGELLPQDLYEDWTEERRAHLQTVRLELLMGLAALHEEREEYGAAIEALRDAVAEEPTREEAHLGLMRLYVLAGRREGALWQYERFAEALRREFGTQPGPEARRLHAEITAGRFPPERPPTGETREPDGIVPEHNLPAARSSFVGRERELVEVKRQLSMSRLLTLTGAGGSGKTRLALEAAKDLAGLHPDGVWLVELASLPEQELVPLTAASALKVREQPGRPLTDTLISHLRKKDLLLILDNCEHVVDAAASLADTLLDACPDLKVLATSREALRTPGKVL